MNWTTKMILVGLLAGLSFNRVMAQENQADICDGYRDLIERAELSWLPPMTDDFEMTPENIQNYIMMTTQSYRQN